MRKPYGDYSANAVGGFNPASMGVFSARKRRKKSHTVRRSTKKNHRKSSRRSGGRKVFTAKNGRKYIKLRSGKARFIKG